MTSKYVITDSTMPRIIDTGPTQPKLDPAAVAAALGAVPAPVPPLPAGGSPLARFAARRETYHRLRAAPVPVSADQWQALEELAAAAAGPGFAPTAAEVARALLGRAIADARQHLSADALRELVAAGAAAREPADQPEQPVVR